MAALRISAKRLLTASPAKLPQLRTALFVRHASNLPLHSKAEILVRPALAVD